MWHEFDFFQIAWPQSTGDISSTSVEHHSPWLDRVNQMSASLAVAAQQWIDQHGTTVSACVLSTSVAHTVTAPLDRVKLCLQTRPNAPWVHNATSAAGAGGGAVVPRPLFAAIGGLWKEMVRARGWSSLWRGNGIYVRSLLPRAHHTLELVARELRDPGLPRRACSACARCHIQ